MPPKYSKPLTVSELDFLLKMLKGIQLQGSVDNIRKSLEMMDRIESKLTAMKLTAPAEPTKPTEPAKNEPKLS